MILKSSFQNSCIFLGKNIVKKVIVKSDDYLGANYDFSNILAESYENSVGSNGIANETLGNNEIVTAKDGKSVYIPFYLDDLESEMFILTADVVRKIKIE